MGWKQIISDSPFFQIVGSAASMNEWSPDSSQTLLLADLSQAKEQVLPQLSDLMGRTNIDLLLVVDLQNKVLIQELKEIGIRGILTTHCDAQEIKTALESIRLGKRFYCGDILDVLMQPLAPVQPTKSDDLLSTREIEVLKWVAKGLTTNQIADQLNVSTHTINSHRKNMLKKLELASPVELIVYAVKKGLVELD
ncbi:MAG: response regulator transcription factor [Reichenbachiella sp.]|uniref:response regulator transcription factor n=1 Tax=Reichenbachiella sp. TaxID=2184521 RepID=UPI003266B77D